MYACLWNTCAIVIKFWPEGEREREGGREGGRDIWIPPLSLHVASLNSSPSSLPHSNWYHVTVTPTPLQLPEYIMSTGSSALDGTWEPEAEGVHTQVRRLELWSHCLGDTHIWSPALPGQVSQADLDDTVQWREVGATFDLHHRALRRFAGM